MGGTSLPKTSYSRSGLCQIADLRRTGNKATVGKIVSCTTGLSRTFALNGAWTLASSPGFNTCRDSPRKANRPVKFGIHLYLFMYPACEIAWLRAVTALRISLFRLKACRNTGSANGSYRTVQRIHDDEAGRTE